MGRVERRGEGVHHGVTQSLLHKVQQRPPKNSCTTTSDEKALLDEGADNAECVVDGALDLRKDKFVGGAAQDGTHAAHVLDSSHLHILQTTRASAWER
jgi:hypothetical protein